MLLPFIWLCIPLPTRAIKKVNYPATGKHFADDYHWHIEIMPILEKRSKSYSIKEVYFNAVSARAGCRATPRNRSQFMSMRSKNRQHGGAISTLVSLLFLAAFCAVIYFARHPLCDLLRNPGSSMNPRTKADAIIVMSDDNFYADRATQAHSYFARV